MGSNAFGPGEAPAHHVSLPSFEIMTTEVTVGMWRALMDSATHGSGDDAALPVEGISWFDAEEFIRRLQMMDSTHSYSLPSEAQWEYACLAGSEHVYHGGDSTAHLVRQGWFLDNADGQAHAVAQKQPNAWGLYDMHGNVSEWCRDWLYASYEGAPNDGSAWEHPPAQFRVRRGGGWADYAGACRTTARTGSDPLSGWWHFGFRVVRVPLSQNL